MSGESAWSRLVVVGFRMVRVCVSSINNGHVKQSVAHVRARGARTCTYLRLRVLTAKLYRVDQRESDRPDLEPTPLFESRTRAATAQPTRSVMGQVHTARRVSRPPVSPRLCLKSASTVKDFRITLSHI